MFNKIKLTASNGQVGIGYTLILPDKLMTFLDTYTTHLMNENEDDTLVLYANGYFGDSQDKKDTKWRRLLSYAEAYGELQDYEVLVMGNETMQNADGTDIDMLRTDVLLHYRNKSIKHKLTLILGTL